MTAELEGAWVLGGIAARHFAGPEPAGSPELGDLFKEVVVDVEKERELRGETVYGETGSDRCIDIGQTIVQREGQFLDGRRAGFSDVIPADAERMPFGNLPRAVGDGVGDKAQRGLRGKQPFFLSDVFLGRHSTLNSYLELILLTLTGRIGVKCGNIFLGHLMPMGSHTPEEDPKTWKTVMTNIPLIMGVFPPNVLPEEIDNDHPERIRGLIVSGSNPLRSYADTNAYEKAFAKLDLLVTIEVAMSETAALSHYVLPARSGYEKWDGTFFQWGYPDYYFDMRRPVVQPNGEQVEEATIYVELAERLGMIPDYPSKLRELAGDRPRFGLALMEYIQANPKAEPWLAFILAKPLGEELGSKNLAVPLHRADVEDQAGCLPSLVHALSRTNH